MMTNLAWGGYRNGLIPQDVLVAVGKDSFGQVQYLEASAARAYFALDAAFYRQFHKHLVVNYGNRTLADQEEFYAAYKAHPATNPFAAYPGTSNHGWARACDFGSGTQYAGTPEALWLKEHGPDYGFWPTGYGFPKVEPWHYDFRPGTATASLDPTPIRTEQDDDMTIFYRPTNDSTPTSDGISRIWAGRRAVAGIDYADVWGIADNGEGRRLLRKQWEDLTKVAEGKGITLPVIDCTGNELEQIVYAPKL